MSVDTIPPKIHCFEEVSSTMEVAREMLTRPTCDVPFAVLAETQSLGRGTTGRKWSSPKGNVYLTICVATGEVREDVIPILPLVCGLACRAAVMELIKGATLHLKWPNDIIYAGKKVGGSLVESTAEHLIIGIGLNVGVAPPVTDAGRESEAINHIATALGVPAVTPQAVAEVVWKHFFKLLCAKDLTASEIIQRFEEVMDTSLTLYRRTAAGRDSVPLYAVRLNEWGHLVVRLPDGSEDTLVAEYLF
ncbi:putative Biotin lipoate A B protein ligase family [Trypanosoma vivax]|uniref:Putative biotin/lipoate protein ligase-like protein n=1 Tax=Trypanosoma vivax (strain Y486) TaxID=1055687 RepID=G0UCP3_TRYVY|nr:putative biotin/lipoate protein ligase-like protein [Trypanosoma vivax]KAH8608251.1 putative Biotin lipoate A B protein ligase family [Trypanosoma vivax]CCC53603.1 putative biotin/lipoate protein ligase-like protein [Trypanosoma vivax Y486]